MTEYQPIQTRCSRADGGERVGRAEPAAAATRRGECGCRLAAVRRDLEAALRTLSEMEMRLPLDEELRGVAISPTEAERLDRYCLNVKVSLEDLQRWSRLLTGSAESLARRRNGAGNGHA